MMEDSNCLCQPDIPAHLRSPETKPTEQNLSSFKCVVGCLTFESTRVGTTAKETFKFKNESEEAQTYVTRRDPNINPIYHAFDFKLAKTTVASGDYLICTVTYSPQIPRQKNVDYLQILDNNCKLYEVYLQGSCIGPHVNFSGKTLYFYNTNYGKALINTFEIKNMSGVPTTFQFDVNEEEIDQEIFTVDKVRGVLRPFQHAYITVKFATKQNGIFCKNLVCLIMNHEPIMLELIGVQMPNLDFKVHDVTLRRYPQTKDEMYGYGGYMYDSLKAMIHKPPFSLSVNYLDFGRVEFQKNDENSRSLVTSLTNHRNEELEIVWINDNNKKISLTPEEIVLPPGESVMYEVQLKSDLPDQLYSKLLIANVYCTNFRQTVKNMTSLEVIDVPLNLSLKVLGHSFPENKIWLPIVEIKPNVVILPPSMPTRPSYTTVMLKSCGHLPTSFKFIPPNKSNFLLKPMEGIIYDFQIIVVQIQTDSHNKKAYVERWGVELNGRNEECLPFYLKGYSEYPSVTVGVNNIVTFDTVYPGCQDILDVAVRNTSTHFLTYNFILQRDSQYSIDYPQGELASNETISIKWYFTGHLKQPEISQIRCEVRTVQNTKLITGLPLYCNVVVYSKCCYSELCAMPNSFDFGLTKWGTKHSATFHLFNFGESVIHFELIRKDTAEETEEFSIVPTTGSVRPGEKVKIVVHLKITKLGHPEIKLAYRVRLNKISTVIVDNGKEYEIFSMQYNCIYPTLQITDICSNNFGFLFSKASLWEIFNVDEINKALKTINHDEAKFLDMFLPDYEIGEADFFATLLVHNETPFPTELKLKRKKICNCKLITQSQGISLRKITYNCIHKDMFTFTLSEGCIEPNMTQKLRLDVKYLEHGLTKMMYILYLSDNRQINLTINIHVLPMEVTMASKYSHNYEFKLKSVFIGEKEPPAQAFPLYNNSAFEIHYDIDTTPIANLNFDYGFDIFTILNPTGTILPFTSHNIILNFIPIEARTYNVAVPLIMGENEISLEIHGDGVTVFDYRMAEVTHSLPCSSKAHFMENPIELSVYHLIVQPFLTWSKTEKMIFIRNQTSDRIVGYSWQSCTVEGVVHAEVLYRKGVLKPKECHAVIIRINSFDQPCHLRLQMVCKLLDHTQHIKHKESVVAYNRKQEELAGQFTITEKGTFYPKNDVVILPKAESFYTTLAISFSIISVSDRDLWLNNDEQLEQWPQYSLHTNVDNIFKEYFQPIISTGSQLYISAADKADETYEDENPRLQHHYCRGNLDKDHTKLFKSFLECLIADAVLSNLFCKIVSFTNNTPQPYYIQFKMNDSRSTSHISKEEAFAKGQEDLEKRMDLVKSYLHKPQMPFLANVFNELIADSVHEIFKLGPQIKKRPHKPYIYHCAKSKFRCMVCKCDQ